MDIVSSFLHYNSLQGVIKNDLCLKYVCKIDHDQSQITHTLWKRGVDWSLVAHPFHPTPRPLKVAAMKRSVKPELQIEQKVSLRYFDLSKIMSTCQKRVSVSFKYCQAITVQYNVFLFFFHITYFKES